MNTGIIFDLVLVVVFAIAVISGVVSGFIRMLLKLAAVAVSIVAGLLLSPPVAGWIYNSFIAPGLGEKLAEKIVAYNATGAAIELPFGMQTLLPISQITGAETQAQAEAAANNIMQNTLSGPITSTVRILVFVVIFLIVLLILLWVAKAAKVVNKVPVLGAFNRVFGGVLGAVIGFVVCYVLALLCNFVLQTLANTISPATMAQIDGAVIYNWVLHTDLLSLIS